nr:putative pentatricopeptide repeat-containing protein At5g43820 [Ipomoea trifida]
MESYTSATIPLLPAPTGTIFGCFKWNLLVKGLPATQRERPRRRPAMQPLRLLALLAAAGEMFIARIFTATVFTTRYSPPYRCSLFSLFPFSTIDIPVNHLENKPPSEEHTENNCRHIGESHILNQLSELLPIRHISSIQKSTAVSSSDSQKQSEIVALDGLLPPEDKFRGVFLQKLRGISAIERELASVGLDPTLDLVAKVVNRGNLGGEAMVTFFSWAMKQKTIAKDANTYNVILKALGRRKFFTHMMALFENMRAEGITPTSTTIFIVLDSFIRARHVSKAIQLFGKLEDYGFKCDTEALNVLLQSLCRRSHVGAASSLLVKMKERVALDGMTYSIVIGGWARFGRVNEIEKALKNMVEDGFDPDNMTYSYVLEGLGRAGQLHDAIEIFEGLDEKGHIQHAEVYNSMISNFISVGQIDEGLKYYRRMLSNNCEPNAETYTRLISAFLKARRVADTIEMFDEMIGKGIIPSTGTVTSFLEPLCSYGPPHAALMIYKKAREAGCVISPSAFKLLLMRLSRFGKCGMLLTIWNEMQESGYSSDMQVYEYVINGLCNIGQLENAVLVMEEALQKGFYPSKLICSKLSNKLLASNKIETAYKLFLKIKTARSNQNAQRYWRAKGWHF